MGRRGGGGDLPAARERGEEGTLASPGPRAPSPEPPDEPPPPGGRWSTLYGVVLGSLAVLILLFYAFTKAFE
jgi:hypothetical protein